MEKKGADGTTEGNLTKLDILWTQLMSVQICNQQKINLQKRYF